MSYSNPDIVLIDNPVGLDKVIQSIQTDLNNLAWLQKSFGRAWEMSDEGKTVPKVYAGDGEYMNVLPNDFLKSQSFIATKGEEIWTDYTKSSANNKERKLKIIFWFNIKEVIEGDHINTEKLKHEVEAVLKICPYIKSIDSYVDEQAEDVFEGYDLSEGSQYLMHPYSGMRFDITVGYREHTNC